VEGRGGWYNKKSGCMHGKWAALQGKDEVALDFTIDDTTGGEKEDALMGMSFHVPREATGFPALDEDTPSNVVRPPPPYVSREATSFPTLDEDTLSNVVTPPRPPSHPIPTHHRHHTCTSPPPPFPFELGSQLLPR